jgi:hypothetical protein
MEREKLKQEITRRWMNEEVIELPKRKFYDTATNNKSTAESENISKRKKKQQELYET